MAAVETTLTNALHEEIAMGLRPRTPRGKKMKERRCPKCGKLINRQRKRCKTCHQVTPL
jgi:hypothetical protein